MGGESTSSILDANTTTVGGKPMDKDAVGKDTTMKDHTAEIEKNASPKNSSCLLLVCSPCAFICNSCGSSEESSEQQMSEEGMFSSLCELEARKSILDNYRFNGVACSSQACHFLNLL